MDEILPGADVALYTPRTRRDCHGLCYDEEKRVSISMTGRPRRVDREWSKTAEEESRRSRGTRDRE